MPDIPIEQAVYEWAGDCRLLARSPGFLDEWLPHAERLCRGFGARPEGVACPGAVFAQPLGRRHVAVMQVADVGRPLELGFRLLVVERGAYVRHVGEPFALADRFAPPWQARGELPALSWPAEPLPWRTVEQIQAVLQRPDGPTLLGGVQALLDGSRLVFERPGPDTELLRGLWALLPDSSRSELWPASFAFGNALRFDALIVPHAAGEAFPGYMDGRDAENYPEGRYELHLQIAAEAGDQRALDELFARRSRRQTFRLGLVLLAVIAVVMLWMKLLTAPAPPAKKPPGKGGRDAAPQMRDLPHGKSDG
jgi:hypothetical protein